MERKKSKKEDTISILVERYDKYDNLITLKSKVDFVVGDRLFYELGFNKVISRKEHWKTHDIFLEHKWIKSNKFKEIKDPETFIKLDDRLNDPEFIKHHNFVILKNQK